MEVYCKILQLTGNYFSLYKSVCLTLNMILLRDYITIARLCLYIQDRLNCLVFLRFFRSFNFLAMVFMTKIYALVGILRNKYTPGKVYPWLGYFIIADQKHVFVVVAYHGHNWRFAEGMAIPLPPFSRTS